ncbi:PREDICTED: G protein pathway suppressor 2 [Nicrophorus vespilloides]|uniref:G protein pathway suppressor 2 n=1 Tax=Nicrophorus vespilloides TaxID=110193 RepID=A0ABM1MYT2_NICVS|nr:PREDICTED: G protein pathway suppressor 2 [Nicrophorus vespilloides]
MPAAVIDKQDRSEQMWNALKKHILRERERKKQEREAEVEEERLRKEREAREQQDVMTLGETKEQISQLESKLSVLKEEKHQLFLQLKRVLNEDDNRRKQLHKETSEVVALQNIPPSIVHQQLYMPSSIPRGTPVPQQNLKPATKRPRSPSPVSLYHQNYGFKPTNVTNPSYQSPQKDARPHEFVRAVLWNKTPQYANQPGAFYTVPPQELSIYYSQQGAIQSREPARQVFETARPPPTSYHLEQKPMEHYPLRPSSSHVIHSGAIAINPQPQQQPNKTGSITSGYPIRHTQYQQVPAPASALYTAQSRPIYQSPSAPMNYPPREQ